MSELVCRQKKNSTLHLPCTSLHLPSPPLHLPPPPSTSLAPPSTSLPPPEVFTPLGASIPHSTLLTVSIDRLKSASLLTDLTHTHKNRMTNMLTTTGEVHTTSRSASSEQTRQPAGEDFCCTKFTQTRSRKINPPQRYTMIANKYFFHIYFLLILACVSYIFTSTLEFNFSVCSETHVKAEYALQDPTPCKIHIFLFSQIMQHKRFETRTLYL